jgi:DNA-binding NarL/FixJ family response regulator
MSQSQNRRDSKVPAETPAEPAAKAKSGAVRICLVEDDARMRSLFKDWIESTREFRCVGSYGDGPAAVAALPKDQPEIVLMDINLPHFNGIECVRRLKDKMPKTQFVMLTVYEDTEHIFSALKAGAVGYLLKRCTRQELLEALEEVRTGGSPMTSIIARKVVQAFGKPESSEFEELSPRERAVLEMLAQGLFCKEIAESLQIRLNTVYTYIRRIYEKLHVHSRMEAVAKIPRSPVDSKADE